MTSAISQSAPEVVYVYKASFLRVIDGDTLELRLDRGFDDWTRMIVRLYGVDTPERRGPERPAGDWVSKKVEELFDGCEKVIAHSKVYDRDSFGRALFDVWIDDVSLSDYLVAKGYAWKTDDKGKIIGKRDIESLCVPEGIKQLVREELS